MNAMKSLGQQILSLAASQPEGTPLMASELLHLGNRAAVDQALSRLAKSGQLLRAGRGVYLQPVSSRFGTRAPEAAKVVEAIQHHGDEVVVPNEAASANALGLSTQVPMRQTYLTSGKSRRLQIGKQVLELKHAPAWKLRCAGRPVGTALRALAGAGPMQAPQMARLLRKKLAKAQLIELSQVSTRYMPTWLATELRALSAHG